MIGNTHATRHDDPEIYQGGPVIKIYPTDITIRNAEYNTSISHK